MELRHFRYFVAVAERLSFVKAAESLNISQPPLSRQIRDFETEVGTPLFIRGSQGTSLTKAGAYLFEESKRLLATVDSICRTARTLGDTGSRSLRVGCVNFLLNTLLAPYFKLLTQRYPELRFEILVMATEAQAEALREGRIDLGFVRSWVRDDGLVFEPLSREHMCVIYPHGSCSATLPEEALKALALRPFVTLSTASAPGLIRRIEDIFEENGLCPIRGPECNDSHSIVRLVSEGLGWSIVPDLAVREARSSSVDSLALPGHMDFGLCWSQERLGPDALKAMEVAREFFRDQAPQLPAK